MPSATSAACLFPLSWSAGGGFVSWVISGYFVPHGCRCQRLTIDKILAGLLPLSLEFLLLGFRLCLEHHDAGDDKWLAIAARTVARSSRCFLPPSNSPNLLDDRVQHSLLVRKEASGEHGDDDREGDEEGLRG